jgi:hypothetical protein
MFALKFTAQLRNNKCSHEHCSPTSKCSQETFVTHWTDKHCSQTLFVRLGLDPA